MRVNLSKGGNVLNKNELFLYDEIGNSYERKNKYLLELNTFYSRLESASSEEKADLKKRIAEHKKNKATHPYIVAHKAFIQKEKAFNKQLKRDTGVFRAKIDSSMPLRYKNLKVDLFKAQAQEKFYAEYQEFCYEASLKYNNSRIYSKQLPEIISNYEITHKALKEAQVAIKNIDKDKQSESIANYQLLKSEEKKKLIEGKKRLKSKRSEGRISEKALKNGLKELKLKRKEILKLGSYNIEKNSIKEEIKNKKYLLNQGIKRQIKVLKSNGSDLRRVTPVETNRTVPWHVLVSFFLPGLGQLLNKQFFKALLFAIASIFIYTIAIPYALGYGNYQGDGISGLITLAADGRRIDKSLIFMIEGIVAIFLVLISMGLYIISARDVYMTDVAAIKGIRPKNWFETLVTMENEGFPYLVSLPALIVTIFIVLVPISTAILLSFTGMNPQNQSKFPWVGLDNYRLLIRGEGLAGSVFYSILLWTLIWTVVATTLAILAGFFLALLVNNDRVKGKVFFRTIFLLPWAVPAFITIMFFSIMFSPNGALTVILSDLFNQPILIKSDAILSRITLIMLQMWLGSSYVFLLSTGVLQAIPDDLYEAAQIDGATAWQRLKRITLPIVLFQTAPLLVGQYTFNFNNFSIIYLFNSGGPFNPSKYGNLAGSTDLLISYIFKLTMDNQYQAIGAAITIVISLGLMMFAFVGFRNSKAFKEERL